MQTIELTGTDCPLCDKTCKTLAGLSKHLNAIHDTDHIPCQHPDLEVEAPCCTMPEPDTGYIACGCGGQYRVYCPDCHNDDLTDEQAQDALDNEFETGGY